MCEEPELLPIPEVTPGQELLLEVTELQGQPRTAGLTGAVSVHTSPVQGCRSLPSFLCR